ncbi:MAG: class II glutamine amidotransferase [Myxococcaceae bacterium]
MCRLFGFRSSEVAKVHDSLVLERNSLRVQSRKHKDGWGIASYVRDGTPEVAHGLGPAHADPEFERVSGLLTANTVLAHVRLATVGDVVRENAHPFIHGRWAFAHNGTLCGFSRHKDEIESLIATPLRTRIRGETDSERCFYFFLSQLPDMSGKDVPLEGVARALARTGARVCQLTPTHGPTDKPSAFTAIVTDGERMVALRWNRSLYFSERKRRAESHGARPQYGSRLAQIVIASEELEGETHWHEVPEAALVGVDRDFTLHFWHQRDLL